MPNNRKNNKKPVKRDDLVKSKAPKKKTKTPKKVAVAPVEVPPQPPVSPVLVEKEPEATQVNQSDMEKTYAPAFSHTYEEEPAPALPPFQRFLNWAKASLRTLANIF